MVAALGLVYAGAAGAASADEFARLGELLAEADLHHFAGNPVESSIRSPCGHFPAIVALERVCPDTRCLEKPVAAKAPSQKLSPAPRASTRADRPTRTTRRALAFEADGGEVEERPQDDASWVNSLGDEGRFFQVVERDKRGRVAGEFDVEFCVFAVSGGTRACGPLAVAVGCSSRELKDSLAAPMELGSNSTLRYS